MSLSLPAVFRHPTIRVSTLAIFLYGFAGAATSPYQSVIGIRELGLSNSTYSALMLAAAAVNVIVSLSVGNLADRLGNYRSMLLGVSAFGLAGYGLVYAIPAPAIFVTSALLLLPVFNAINPLLFANVRATTNRMGGQDVPAINSGVRAAISLAWVLVPGIVAFILSQADSMLPAYLIAAIACGICLAILVFFLPRQAGAGHTAPERLTHLAAFAEVLSPRIFIRVLAVSLITSTLHVNGAVLPLIMTGAAKGKVTDIGVIVGIVAFLEIVFIFGWGAAQRRLDHVTALVVGTAIYVVYLALLGFSSLPWHVYALTIPSGIGAAALISIPITYLQDLIAKRPGLGSALISVNMFLGGGISALLFAIGTWASGYSGTAILGAGAGTVGLLLLLILERRATNLRGRL
ncbi:MFS transporter [Rhizobium sp. RAF56]|uniref:MFS transporter n=1 Tax=Rhizobium sp. RAF56 TaxID=3233062 RepID=UPI003F9B7EBE